MLILTRRIGETVVVVDSDSGEEVKITVLRSNKGQVSIGFDAPPSKLIYREEIYPGNKKKVPANSKATDIPQVEDEPETDYTVSNYGDDDDYS